jgi:hypothetical protein
MYGFRMRSPMYGSDLHAMPAIALSPWKSATFLLKEAVSWRIYIFQIVQMITYLRIAKWVSL